MFVSAIERSVTFGVEVRGRPKTLAHVVERHQERTPFSIEDRLDCSYSLNKCAFPGTQCCPTADCQYGSIHQGQARTCFSAQCRRTHGRMGWTFVGWRLSEGRQKQLTVVILFCTRQGEWELIVHSLGVQRRTLINFDLCLSLDS